MKSRFFSFAFVIISTTCFCQTFYQNPVYTRAFDTDSLKDFDELKARETAISQGYLGSEFKIKMYRLKRDYINAKYNLKSEPLKNYNSGNAFNERPSPLSTCLNEDFEASPMVSSITLSTQIQGWTISGGLNNPYLPTSPNTPGYNSYFPNGLPGVTSCNLLGCCPMPPSHSAIVDCSAAGGFIDFTIGTQYPIFSVFGTGTVSGSATSNTQIAQGLFGSKVLRINDDQTGDYSIEKVARTISVTAANCYFQYAFLPVMAPGHSCCDAGGFQVIFTNAATNSVLSCPGYSLSAPSPNCVYTATNTLYNCGIGSIYDPTVNSGNIYSKWKIKAVDLTPYIGQVINMDVIVTDCNAGGHFGYLYFDAQCGSVSLDINSNEVIAGDSIVNFTTCDSLVVLKAMNNFSGYHWSGPGGMSVNSSTLSTSVPGMYVLTMTQSGLCSPITRSVNIQSIKSVNVFSSDSIICAGSPVNLTATGFTTNIWSDGNTTSSISVTPTITTTYSVTGITSGGCLASLDITQQVAECTGVNSLKKSGTGISIYPNPNTGEFSLQMNTELQKGELIIESLFGQVVHRQIVYQGKNAIKTKGLSSGIYYYSILNNKQLISKGKLKIE